MSDGGDGSVELTWAGDLRRFRLPIDSLVALERACESTCSDIYMRLAASRWGVRDVRETIRIGLIGGGSAGKEALALVDAHVIDGKLHESVLLAQAVLAAAIFGPPDDPLGKSKAAIETPEANASRSPPS